MAASEGKGKYDEDEGCEDDEGVSVSGDGDDDNNDSGGGSGCCRRVSRPPRGIVAGAKLTSGQATTRQRAIKNARVSGEERRTRRKKENGTVRRGREGDARICAFIRADTLGGQ